MSASRNIAPSVEQLDAIIDGLSMCHLREWSREFLRVWIRNWTAIKLAQAEQEPVAKVVLTETLGLPCLQWLDLNRQFDFEGGEFLYTAPPRIEQLGLVNIARQLAALADGLEAGNSSAEEAAARLARVAKGVVG